MVLWVPDWPVAAAVAEGLVDPQLPVAVHDNRGVVVASAPARAAGVRQGMRRRSAQQLCPELVLVPVDPVRDARAFEPLVQAVETVVAEVEVVRPGMVVFLARGPVRHVGSEDALAELLVGTVATETGAECQVGVGDGLLTAMLAARAGVLVPVEASAAFLAGQDVGALSLAADERGRGRAGPASASAPAGGRRGTTRPRAPSAGGRNRPRTGTARCPARAPWTRGSPARPAVQASPAWSRGSTARRRCSWILRRCRWIHETPAAWDDACRNLGVLWDDGAAVLRRSSAPSTRFARRSLARRPVEGDAGCRGATRASRSRRGLGRARRRPTTSARSPCSADTGANALGGLVGTALAAQPSRVVRGGSLAAAVGLTLLSERVSFSRVIERTGPLRRLDALGRRAR
ncbi:hypothetical protein [Georgenia sp. SUBG003]|uniref:Y-family DNA polymerase n=1 Tax=Georgenia sp. SUBG003 TaxID=1497974 RepID=UPI003AB5BC5A